MKNRILTCAASLIEVPLLAYLIYNLLLYGLTKVFERQFVVRLASLDATVEELDGFQLAWAFHGFSRQYEVFLGAMEVFAAILLLFERTRRIGILLTVGIMTNITILNIEYDIGAISVAFPMLVSSFLLAVLRFRELKAVLWDRSNQINYTPEKVEVDWWPRKITLVANSLVLVSFLYSCFVFGQLYVEEVKDICCPPEVYGRYRIVGIESNNTDPTLLEQFAEKDIIYFDFSNKAGWRRNRDFKLAGYSIEEQRKSFELTITKAGFEYTHKKYRGSEEVDSFFSENNSPLTIKGIYEKDPKGNLRLDIKEPAQFSLQLMKEDLNWPQKYQKPFSIKTLLED
ncbi:MAG: hypothetical protein JNN15_17125 [Blastocatellia bacterium]|nr:hypothetical protein [Blastocatellia bacterium]